MGWGDELIVCGHVREFHAQHGKKVRIAYERNRWHEAFDHNPKIAAPGEHGDFYTFIPRTHGLRPYCAEKTPSRWTWKPYRPPRGELFFTEEETALRMRFGGRVIFNAAFKLGASPNKDWGWANWGALNGMAERAGIKVTQLGEIAPQMLHGAEYVQTRTMRLAAAVIAGARAVVTHEGAVHHAAAAFGVPTVVIFGSYVGPLVTGYDNQTNLFIPRFDGDLGCGMRTSCDHCKRSMAQIHPEDVFHALLKILK